MASALTTVDPLAAVEQLAPRITQTRQRAAADRQLPDDLAREIAAAGLFRLLVPRALGGLELAPLAAAEVVEAASRIDGSAGWCVMVGAQSAWFASFLPAAERVLGSPTATLAGTLRPSGTATPVAGGYRVTGRWGLASGSTYADHLYATCVVESAQAPRLRVVYVSAAEATVIDSWHSIGLRGTGSNDFVLSEVVVPEQFTLPFPVCGARPPDGPLYRDGYQNLAFVLQAAQALGMARGALDSFAELATARVRWTTGSALSDQPVVQATVARAEAQVRSARAWLWEVVGGVWETILSGAPPTADQRIMVRLAVTHAITAAADAAETLHRAAGAAALDPEHPLQRQFQDLRTAGAHVQAAPAILELTGGLLLGADTAPSPLL